jgi:hypothetical protein
VIRAEPRLRRLVGIGLALVAAAEPVGLIAQLASLSFDGDTAIAVPASGFGRVLGLRLAIACSPGRCSPSTRCGRCLASAPSWR